MIWRKGEQKIFKGYNLAKENMSNKLVLDNQSSAYKFKIKNRIGGTSEEKFKP